MIRCNHCGHHHPNSESLEALDFQWFDQHTSKVQCESCKTYTLQRVTSYKDGLPLGGEFLVVKTKLKR